MSKFLFTAAESAQIRALATTAFAAYDANKSQPGIFTELYDTVTDILGADFGRLDNGD